MRPHLLIATTVPETLAFILKDQPRFLSRHLDVDIVTSPSHQWGELVAEQVPIHAVAMERGISPVRDLVSLCKMIWLMFKLRPDIVHSYTPKAGFVCMLAAWVCRVPIRVHTFTGLIWPTASGWRKSLLKAIDRLLCACATEIIPEGYGVLHDLNKCQITNKPLRVIGNGNIAGVDVEYFSPQALMDKGEGTLLRKYYGIARRDFVFIFVGRLNRDKGINELLEAFKQLPDRCRLLVVGALDESAPISMEALHVLNSHPRVHWMGFQQDIRPAVSVSDVLVLPSYREGFPNVILQAGAMELPVIATDISGCNEVITSGFNGWLVPTQNTEVLAETMYLALRTSASTLRYMGRSARIRVMDRFERTAHWHRMLMFYLTLYQEGRRNENTIK